MKVIIILSLLLLASPVFGELTKEDLRTIIKEEITASEKRMKEYIDLEIETVNARIDGLEKSVDGRFDAVNAKIGDVEKSLNARIDGVEKRIDGVEKIMDYIWVIMVAVIGPIAAAIVTLIILAYKERQKEMQTQIDQLRERLESNAAMTS